LLHALPYAKRLELERRDEAELRSALGGLALLILGAARMRAGGLAVRQIVFAPGGKPRCVGGPFFSISHGRGRVACAVSETVDSGIDIETFAAPASDEVREKARRWTATEAALKAAGLGLRNAAQVQLDAALRHAEIGSTRYGLLAPQLAKDCACHVATVRESPVLEIHAVDLDGPETSLAIERSLGFATQPE
jgi:phosphopantetheinyl transferase